MSALLGLACVRCKREHEGIASMGCPTCADAGLPANLQTIYDVHRARQEFLAALDGPARGLTRYTALLPVSAEDIASPDTGGTPLLEAPRLADALEVRRVVIKDESRGLTWSFKDRAAAVAAAYARAVKSPALVVASTGNAAAATVAHAIRADLPAIVLFAQNVSPTMAAFVRAYGGHVVVTPTKADRWRLMRHCVEEFGFQPNSNYANPPVGNDPYAIDGYKTIGFELWEQLGRRAPSAIYFAVCYGDGLFGVGKAFAELHAMGLVDSLPRLSGGEIYGSLERALIDGAQTVEAAPAEYVTAASSISSPQSTFQALNAVRESGGWVSSVSEDELISAQRMLAELEGLYVETATSAALASALRDRASGRLDADADVVLVSSSSGLKTVNAAPESARAPLVSTPEELIAALPPLFADTVTQRRMS